MPHQTKEVDPYFFVDNRELHHSRRLSRLISNLEALLDGKREVTRKDEQALFRGMHACGFALTKLVRGCAAGRSKATLQRLYNESKEMLVKLNFGLIGEMRRKTRAAHGQDNSDLESDSKFALLNAVRNFDPWRGNKFSTYACTSIIRNFLHAAKRQQSRLNQVYCLAEQMKRRNVGRGKVSAEHEHMLERLKVVVRENRAGLTDAELYVIALRVLHDPMAKPEKLHVIGQDFDVCKERIRQIQVSAIRKLQDYFGVTRQEDDEAAGSEMGVESSLAACA